MENQKKNKIADVFNQNIGNRLSLELAKGMLSTIFEILNNGKDLEKTRVEEKEEK